ncbi:unnamed protein product [Angiostrongylus costaricensis]|uniref:Uncharacterized protein n=1 Tax=Angiostrongylus costaricensis TaxID=334426 RepID=A0A0R3Q0B0_ANGCS|nr:unnamed protein product [Angiostrongylus costaricensis]
MSPPITSQRCPRRQQRHQQECNKISITLLSSLLPSGSLPIAKPVVSSSSEIDERPAAALSILSSVADVICDFKEEFRLEEIVNLKNTNCDTEELRLRHTEDDEELLKLIFLDGYGMPLPLIRHA